MEFEDTHTQSKSPLNSWYYEVKKETWRTSADVKQKYSSASLLSNNRIVFNIGGNKYRLLCRINYTSKIVYILFIGTHKEYDHIDANTYSYRG